MTLVQVAGGVDGGQAAGDTRVVDAAVGGGDRPLPNGTSSSRMRARIRSKVSGSTSNASVMPWRVPDRHEVQGQLVVDPDRREVAVLAGGRQHSRPMTAAKKRAASWLSSAGTIWGASVTVTRPLPPPARRAGRPGRGVRS